MTQSDQLPKQVDMVRSRDQAEEILTLGESLIDAWTGIAVCSTDWWGGIEFELTRGL